MLIFICCSNQPFLVLTYLAFIFFPQCKATAACFTMLVFIFISICFSLRSDERHDARAPLLWHYNVNKNKNGLIIRFFCPNRFLCANLRGLMEKQSGRLWRDWRTTSQRTNWTTSSKKGECYSPHLTLECYAIEFNWPPPPPLSVNLVETGLVKITRLCRRCFFQRSLGVNSY